MDSALSISPSHADSIERRENETSVFSKAERRAAVILFVLLLAMRVLYACHYRIDSDEPQHLHVVWGWANGQLPYLNFFDNHAPLFHILCAPLFTLLGERADIII